MCTAGGRLSIRVRDVPLKRLSKRSIVTKPLMLADGRILVRIAAGRRCPHLLSIPWALETQHMNRESLSLIRDLHSGGLQALYAERIPQKGSRIQHDAVDYWDILITGPALVCQRWAQASSVP